MITKQFLIGFKTASILFLITDPLLEWAPGKFLKDFQIIK